MTTYRGGKKISRSEARRSSGRSSSSDSPKEETGDFGVSPSTGNVITKRISLDGSKSTGTLASTGPNIKSGSKGTIILSDANTGKISQVFSVGGSKPSSQVFSGSDAIKQSQEAFKAGTAAKIVEKTEQIQAIQEVQRQQVSAAKAYERERLAQIEAQKNLTQAERARQLNLIGEKLQSKASEFDLSSSTLKLVPIASQADGGTLFNVVDTYKSPVPQKLNAFETIKQSGPIIGESLLSPFKGAKKLGQRGVEESLKPTSGRTQATFTQQGAFTELGLRSFGVPAGRAQNTNNILKDQDVQNLGISTGFAAASLVPFVGPTIIAGSSVIGAKQIGEGLKKGSPETFASGAILAAPGVLVGLKGFGEKSFLKPISQRQVSGKVVSRTTIESPVVKAKGTTFLDEGIIFGKKGGSQVSIIQFKESSKIPFYKRSVTIEETPNLIVETQKSLLGTKTVAKAKTGTQSLPSEITFDAAVLSKQTTAGGEVLLQKSLQQRQAEFLNFEGKGSRQFTGTQDVVLKTTRLDVAGAFKRVSSNTLYAEVNGKRFVAGVEAPQTQIGLTKLKVSERPADVTQFLTESQSAFAQEGLVLKTSIIQKQLPETTFKSKATVTNVFEPTTFTQRSAKNFLDFNKEILSSKKAQQKLLGISEQPKTQIGETFFERSKGSDLVTKRKPVSDIFEVEVPILKGPSKVSFFKPTVLETGIGARASPAFISLVDVKPITETFSLREYRTTSDSIPNVDSKILSDTSIIQIPQVSSKSASDVTVRQVSDTVSLQQQQLLFDSSQSKVFTNIGRGSEETKLPIPGKFEINLGSKPGKEKESKKGYYAYAKSKGKYVRVTDTPVSEFEAKTRLDYVLDETASARGKVVPTRKEVKESKQKRTSFFQDYKYTKKKNIYTEKNKFRIDSLGEKRQITVEGLLANERKKQKNNFLKGLL